MGEKWVQLSRQQGCLPSGPVQPVQQLRWHGQQHRRCPVCTKHVPAASHPACLRRRELRLVLLLAGRLSLHHSGELDGYAERLRCAMNPAGGRASPLPSLPACL